MKHIGREFAQDAAAQCRLFICYSQPRVETADVPDEQDYQIHSGSTQDDRDEESDRMICKHRQMQLR